MRLCSYLSTSKRKFLTIWPPNTSSRQLKQVKRNQLCNNKHDQVGVGQQKLHELVSQLATPFGHPAQVVIFQLVLTRVPVW